MRLALPVDVTGEIIFGPRSWVLLEAWNACPRTKGLHKPQAYRASSPFVHQAVHKSGLPPSIEVLLIITVVVTRYVMIRGSQLSAGARYSASARRANRVGGFWWWKGRFQATRRWLSWLCCRAGGVDHSRSLPSTRRKTMLKTWTQT